MEATEVRIVKNSPALCEQFNRTWSKHLLFWMLPSKIWCQIWLMSRMYCRQTRQKTTRDKPQRQRVLSQKGETPFLSAARRPRRCRLIAGSRNDRANSEPGRASGFRDSENAQIFNKLVTRSIYPQISLFRGQSGGPHAKYGDKSWSFSFTPPIRRLTIKKIVIDLNCALKL